MKVVILCGGLGSRLTEETKIKPKPMVKIYDKPILIHIMYSYYKYGFNQFILATGYKSSYIKNYFNKKKFPFKIKIIYTGKNTMTGGRLLRLKKLFKEKEDFMLTYGDGLSNHNLLKLVKFHKTNKKIATLTAVRPPVRFGELSIKNILVTSFKEKQQFNDKWINGGFFVFNYKIFNYIKNDQIMLEREPLSKLSKNKQLMAYKHKGFWQCMDNMRDKILLAKLVKSKNTPWL
jgi:glucose-1-phosphate cytidylyltransferase